MSLVPSLKVANLGNNQYFTVNSFLPYLRLTVKISEIFQFLRLSTKFLAVLRLSVNPTETLFLRSGFEPATSSSADQRSPGWANQKAEVNKNLAHCYLIVEILTYPVRVINKHFGQKSTANFAICLLQEGGEGGRDEVWDRETMFS